MNYYRYSHVRQYLILLTVFPKMNFQKLFEDIKQALSKSTKDSKLDSIEIKLLIQKIKDWVDSNP